MKILDQIRVRSRRWAGHLAPYAAHRHLEHWEALVAEVVRYAGLRLENWLADSPEWRDTPLWLRTSILLYLIDRGLVQRRRCLDGQLVLHVAPGADRRIAIQPIPEVYARALLRLVEAVEQAARIEPVALS